MNVTNKLYQWIASAVLFCISIAVLTFFTNSYSALLEETSKMIYDQELYQQYNQENKETITYSELIASLMQPLDYDIKVDGLSISKYEHYVDMISDYSIRNGVYHKRYQYDNRGNITLVIYTSE